MDSKKPFYITTTLPYVNAEPHVGFAMELIRADAIARYKTLMGYEVFFNTGTDEHGQKLYDGAKDKAISPQEFVDEYAESFKKLLPTLGILPQVHFIRTTDEQHVHAAQEFWKLCDKNGYIYKKEYKIKYCVGCELEKTESELVDGRCPIHPNRELEIREEENYFFKWSEFGDKLLDLYEKNPNFVTPDFRFNEIKEFVKRGLQDFSISRLKEKMSWGIPVPGDDDHVMYVWFDALVNYISTLGWPDNKEQFETYWVNGTPVQYAGKDNLRQQSAMWQAMLMAAGLPNSDRIIINGHITADGGIKMSKSLGNVINPYDVVKEYGTDALRYYLLREVNSFEDSPFTMDLFAQAYNANLVNGLGNFTSRVLQMAQNYEVEYKIPIIKEELMGFGYSFNHIVKDSEMERYSRYFDEYDIGKVLDLVWQHINYGDKVIEDKKPFELIKKDKEEAKRVVADLLQRLFRISVWLQPLLPDTAYKIQEAISQNKKPETPLFVRK